MMQISVYHRHNYYFHTHQPTCPVDNTLLQVELVCLVAQCTADSSRWEAGLRHCENAMGVLPSTEHLPISMWKVSSWVVQRMYCVLHSTSTVPCYILSCLLLHSQGTLAYMVEHRLSQRQMACRLDTLVLIQESKSISTQV